MRRMPQQHANSHVRRERDRYALRRQATLLVCCLLLAGGFVAAARQQFAAVTYGYRSEELRRERERLLEEQRHLRLALEESSSPVYLEREATRMGLQPARASQIGAGAPVGEAETDGTAINVARRETDAARRSTNAERGPASTFVGSAATSLRR